MEFLKRLFMFVLITLSIFVCIPAMGYFCFWLAGGENAVCEITVRNALCVIAFIVMLYLWIEFIFIPLILKYDADM